MLSDEIFTNTILLENVVRFLPSATDVFTVSRVNQAFRYAVFYSEPLRWIVLWNWRQFNCTPWRKRYLRYVLKARCAAAYVEWLVDMLCESDGLVHFNPNEAYMVARACARIYKLSVKATLTWAVRVCIEPALDRCNGETPEGRLIRSPVNMSFPIAEDLFGLYRLFHQEAIQRPALIDNYDATKETTLGISMALEPPRVVNPDNVSAREVKQCIDAAIFGDHVLLLEAQLHECARHALSEHRAALEMLRCDALALIIRVQELGKTFMERRLVSLYKRYYPKANIEFDLARCMTLTPDELRNMHVLCRDAFFCSGLGLDFTILLPKAFGFSDSSAVKNTDDAELERRLKALVCW